MAELGARRGLNVHRQSVAWEPEGLELTSGEGSGGLPAFRFKAGAAKGMGAILSGHSEGIGGGLRTYTFLFKAQRGAASQGHRDRAGYGSFYPDDIRRYNDPGCMRWPRKVRTYVDPELEARFPNHNGCVVRVTLPDGRVLENRVDYAKGEPENMLSREEFSEKLAALAGDVLSAERRGSLMILLWGIEEIADVKIITELLVS